MLDCGHELLLRRHVSVSGHLSDYPHLVSEGTVFCRFTFSAVHLFAAKILKFAQNHYPYVTFL
jgi:hypothetical protein